jgi:F5/8 type C domain
MALPVVTKASGGLPVAEAANNLGAPVIEASNGFGIAVTKVAAGKGGWPVVYQGGAAVRVSPNNMTSNVLPAPYVASAQSSLGAGYEAFRSFNSTANQFWHSGAAPPQWIKIDLGSALAASSYSIQSRPTPGPNQQTAWTLEGSNNDSTWTTVDTRTGQPTVPTGALIGTYTMTTPGTYRYWRWTFTTTLSGSFVDCGNLALYQ